MYEIQKIFLGPKKEESWILCPVLWFDEEGEAGNWDSQRASIRATNNTISFIFYCVFLHIFEMYFLNSGRNVFLGAHQFCSWPYSSFTFYYVLCITLSSQFLHEIDIYFLNSGICVFLSVHQCLQLTKLIFYLLLCISSYNAFPMT